MKKFLTILGIIIVVLVFGTSTYAFSVRTSAPTSSDSGWKYYSSPLNTFPLSPYNNGNCTWYAYGRAYEVLGKDPGLRGAGNAGAWYNYAKNNGFSVGSTPKAGSIICWSIDGNSGHVAFVESVSGDSVTFTESNYQFNSSKSYSRWRSYTTTHPETYCSASGGKLMGYIYLSGGSSNSSGSSQSNVSFSLDTSSNVINSTDARVYTWLYKKPGQKVTDAGIYIYPSGKLPSPLPTYQESFAANDNFSTRDKVHINYTIGSGKEVNYKLSEGTKYSYVVFCVVDGKEYVTSVGSFTTKGTSGETTSVTGVKFYNDTPSLVENYTDARVYAWLYKKVGQKVTKAGIYLWKTGDASPASPTYTEDFAKHNNFIDREQVHINYVIGSGKEADYKLSEGTGYSYKMFCIVEGKEFVTEVGTFKTKVSHTHSYTEHTHNDQDHPHYGYYKCSCGDVKIDTSKSEFDKNCLTCLNSVKPSKSSLINVNYDYLSGGMARTTVSWEKTTNTTHYNIYFYKQNPSTEKYDQLFREMQLKDNSYTTDLSTGNYRVLVQSYNSNYSYNGDWLYTEADQYWFTISEQESVTPNANKFILTIGEKTAQVWGNIKTNDVAPKLVNGRTMLPARFVAENLGAKVEWDASAQMVTISTNNTDIMIFVGSSKVYVNGKKYTLDSSAFVENGRTYTPVRFIAEALGANVDWNQTNQQVIITK